MGYTKYCQGYSEYTIVNKLTNHLEHKPGVAVEVDWSGPTMTYVDTSTGEIVTVYLFVGTLPYSQYSYVESCRDMKMGSFIRAHIHMYGFFGGVATRLVCDNLKDEKPFLHPLPSVPYEIATWVYGRKVNIDYHVVFEHNRYSCPYQYARKSVDLKVTDSTVEIYSGSARIATHNRFPAGREEPVFHPSGRYAG